MPAYLARNIAFKYLLLQGGPAFVCFDHARVDDTSFAVFDIAVVARWFGLATADHLELGNDRGDVGLYEVGLLQGQFPGQSLANFRVTGCTAASGQGCKSCDESDFFVHDQISKLCESAGRSNRP